MKLLEQALEYEKNKFGSSGKRRYTTEEAEVILSYFRGEISTETACSALNFKSSRQGRYQKLYSALKKCTEMGLIELRIK